jgi:RNA polymerase sigma-70 factor (ECF subfamily)
LRQAFDIEPRLRAMLRRYVKNEADIDELVQTTYLRLYEYSVRGADIERADALAYVIARHAALDLLRRGTVVSIDLIADLEAKLSEDDLIDQRAQPEQQVDTQMQLKLLMQVVRRLPRRSRRVFLLRKVYGLSQTEIAVKLGISENTVEQHLVKAMRQCVAVFTTEPKPSKLTAFMKRVRSTFYRDEDST